MIEIISAVKRTFEKGDRIVVKEGDKYYIGTVTLSKNNRIYYILDNGHRNYLKKNSPNIIGIGVEERESKPIDRFELYKWVSKKDPEYKSLYNRIAYEKRLKKDFKVIEKEILKVDRENKIKTEDDVLKYVQEALHPSFTSFLDRGVLTFDSKTSTKQIGFYSILKELLMLGFTKVGEAKLVEDKDGNKTSSVIVKKSGFSFLLKATSFLEIVKKHPQIVKNRKVIITLEKI